MITLIPALVLGVFGAGLVVVAVATVRRHPFVAIPAGVIGVAGIAAAVVVLVFAEAYRIPSEAMVPTLKVNDRIATIDTGAPANGDIIVFHPPAGATDFEGPQCGRDVAESELCNRPAGGRASVTFVKRVVGVGGDELSIQNGMVTRNGKAVDEPYARPCGTGAGCDYPAPIRVPRGHVYLLGDNRGFSDDSRFWGPVPEDWVVGKVVWRYWPPKRFGSP